MRVVTWNMKSARIGSSAWSYLRDLAPDLALLQEVAETPAEWGTTDCRSHTPIRRSGAPQSFKTTLFARSGIVSPIELSCSQPWANDELRRFSGNPVAQRAQCSGFDDLHVVCAYSPPWPVDPARLAGIDVTGIKLARNNSIWMTDLIWDALRDRPGIDRQYWVVGGDFNSAPTLDDGPGGDRGNREWLDRMRAIGLVDCLAHARGGPIPTFRHSRGAIRHQIDHLFVTPPMLARLRDCWVPPQGDIWRADGHLSDHLPVVAEFE